MFRFFQLPQLLGIFQRKVTTAATPTFNFSQRLIETVQRYMAVEILKSWQLKVECDETKLLIIVMTAPANFRDRCFNLFANSSLLDSFSFTSGWVIPPWSDVTKKNISRQLIRMTWGSAFQLEMVKGKLVFVVGTFDDHHLQQKVIS